MDPIAQTLTHAIAMQEGGGKLLSYDAKSGDVPASTGGRYQFIPDTWKNYAGQVLGDSNAQMTPENQNKVAYTKVKQWLDSGKTPAQVASMWNAGEGAPDSWKPGTKQKVGDTPTYVKNVQKYAQQLSGGGDSQLQKAPSAPLVSRDLSQSDSTTGYAPPIPPGGQQNTQSQGNNGYAPPAPPPPPAAQPTPKAPAVGSPGSEFGDNAIDWAHPPSWVPGGQIGSAIGTKIAEWMHPGQADWIKQNEPGPSGEAIAGDTVRSAALVASLAAAPVTIPGMIAAGAGFGAANAGGNSMVNNDSASDVLKKAGTGALVGGTTAGILGGASRGLSALGSKSVSLAVRPTAADFADGYDSQFAVDNGLTGNAAQIADKTKSYITSLKSELQKVLGDSDTGIDLAGVFDKTKSEFTSQGGLESNFLQNSKIDNALSTLEDEVLRANPSGTLSLPSAQTIKQNTGMYGEWLHGAPDPDANAMSTVANSFYRNLKTAIENAAPEGEVSTINEKIQKAIPIIRAAIRRIPVNERASAISMTDMLSMLGFPLNPGAAVIAPTINHLMNSGRMSSIAPPLSAGLNKLNTAISAQAPNVVNGLLPQR